MGDMTDNQSSYNQVFRRAREIIENDPSITQEEKNAILKLIQVVVDTASASQSTLNAGETSNLAALEIISRYSLLSMVKQQADELDALKRISLNLTSSLDLKAVLDTVVTEAMRLVKHAGSAHIYLYSQEQLEFGTSLSINGERGIPFASPRPNGLTYSVAKSGEQIVAEDIRSHPLFDGAPLDWSGSIIGIPLKFDNSIVGVMNLSRTITGQFTNAELRLLGLLADQAAMAIFNANRHKGLKDLANTDSMTGLPNRRALDARLQEELRYAMRTATHLSVVMMDLDGFKTVNDTYGHSFGDEVLRNVFSYLSEKMRATDFLARYGGDELTLILRDSNLQETEIVTRKIIELMKEYSYTPPVKPPIRLGITAGIAVYPLHSQNAGDLLRAADSALYQAKKHNRGSYAVARGVTGPLNPRALKRRPKE
jgi:diguanylate cyclase (GGDEF)-like protein